MSCREAWGAGCQDRLKGFVVDWREKGGSRPLWWDGGLGCWKKALGGCGWSVPGRPGLGSTGGPVAMGTFGSVAGLPVTWACCTHWGVEGRLHGPPGGPDSSTQPSNGGEPGQQRRAIQGERERSWPRTPALGAPIVWVGLVAAPPPQAGLA